MTSVQVCKHCNKPRQLHHWKNGWCPHPDKEVNMSLPHGQIWLPSTFENGGEAKHEHVFIFNDSECFSCGKTKWELGLDPSAIANEEAVSDARDK